MIRYPYRGEPQLFGAPRHSEDALDIDRLAIMRHAYTEFHGVFPSLYSVATKLRRTLFQKGSPPFLKILSIKGRYGQGLMRRREPREGRVIQHGLDNLLVYSVYHGGESGNLPRHGIGKIF